MSLATVLAVSIFLHMLGDFILQTQEISQLKTKKVSILCFHAGIHGILFAGLTYAIIEDLYLALSVFLWYGGLHALIDSRRWVSGELWPPKPILVDQTLHMGQICLFMFFMEAVI